MRRFLVAFAFFVFFACDAQSQQPPSAGQPGRSEGGKPQQRTEKDERGTEKSPLIVKPIPAPKDEKETAREEKDRKEKFELDSSLVEFTKFLVVVGALQFLVFTAQAWMFFRQLNRMDSGLKISGSVAEAAKINAAAAIDSAEATKRVERAYVAMSHERGIFWGEGESEGAFGIRLNIKNWGRTPGTVEDVRIKAVILPSSEELPEQPDYSESQTLETAKTFLVPQADLTANEHLGIISKSDREALNERTKRLFVYGYVQYVDKFGKRHHGRYGRMYEPRREGKNNNLVYITRGAYNDDVEIRDA